MLAVSVSSLSQNTGMVMVTSSLRDRAFYWTKSSTEALPLLSKSLTPSSQTTAAMRNSDSTSRSSRSLADGPPGNGFCAE
jgi:hypothetical protein